MFTALKGLDYTGKIIRPFVTHEGSGLSSIPSQIKSICAGANVKQELQLQVQQLILQEVKLKNGYRRMLV